MEKKEYKKHLKATDIMKESYPIELIYKEIQDIPVFQFKHFIPSWIYVSMEVKSQLIEDGFKVYIGAWDRIMENCLIIEW